MPELEITAPVDLCTADGRLDPAAVGWSRRPLHRTRIPGWGRRKRWEYWGLVTPRHVVGLTVSSIDYAGVESVYVLDRATGQESSTDAVVPLALGVALPLRSGTGRAAVTAGDLRIELVEVAEGTRLRARTPDLVLDVVAIAFEGHESMAVVVPWSERRFQYTVKDVGRPLVGRVQVHGTAYDLDPSDSFGVLDHGRGVWPYAITWNWGAGAGVLDGRRVGVQVGGRWTDGTGSTENALILDGVVHKHSADLVWEYDTADWLAPWRIHGPGVDLVFTPEHERAARTDLLVVANETHQCFGRWFGTMTDDTGRPVSVDGAYGWAEQAANRW
ncbi:MAG: DUF2804 domain-containing protein [Candidatus Nanopelagicales bacterium]